MNPKVSIITPTTSSRRHELINRCMPSVQKQDYDGEIEHIIVSDGPWTDYLMPAITDINPSVMFIALGRNWRQFSHGASYGAIPRACGTYLASGGIIGYLDDDDEFLPNHVSTHVKAIQEHGVDFTHSTFQRFWSDGRPPDLIGGARIDYGAIGTPCVMHKAECLLTANWGLNGYGEDFELFNAWAKAGLKHKPLPIVTIRVHKTV